MILKKIRIDPDDPVTRSKPGTRALDQVDHRARFKNSDNNNKKGRHWSYWDKWLCFLLEWVCNYCFLLTCCWTTNFNGFHKHKPMFCVLNVTKYLIFVIYFKNKNCHEIKHILSVESLCTEISNMNANCFQKTFPKPSQLFYLFIIAYRY